MLDLKPYPAGAVFELDVGHDDLEGIDQVPLQVGGVGRAEAESGFGGDNFAGIGQDNIEGRTIAVAKGGPGKLFEGVDGALRGPALVVEEENSAFQEAFKLVLELDAVVTRVPVVPEQRPG